MLEALITLKVSGSPCLLVAWRAGFPCRRSLKTLIRCLRSQRTSLLWLGLSGCGSLWSWNWCTVPNGFMDWSCKIGTSPSPPNTEFPVKRRTCVYAYVQYEYRYACMHVFGMYKYMSCAYVFTHLDEHILHLYRTICTNWMSLRRSKNIP